jgi:hypothetical protein
LSIINAFSISHPFRKFAKKIVPYLERGHETIIIIP